MRRFGVGPAPCRPESLCKDGKRCPHNSRGGLARQASRPAPRAPAAPSRISAEPTPRTGAGRDEVKDDGMCFWGRQAHAESRSSIGGSPGHLPPSAAARRPGAWRGRPKPAPLSRVAWSRRLSGNACLAVGGDRARPTGRPAPTAHFRDGDYAI